jgi:hypothetical protein
MFSPPLPTTPLQKVCPGHGAAALDSPARGLLG